jgi:hypothetical protein
MEVEKVKKYLEEKTIGLIKFLYSWITTEGEPLGYILGVCHITICLSLGFMVIISYTLYPALWLQCVIFVLLFIIWLQHIFLKICVSVAAEYVLTKSESPFYTFINLFTSLDPQDWTIHFMVAETAIVGCLFLSLSSRFSLMAYKFYNIEM